jgi:hypothetical protein
MVETSKAAHQAVHWLSNRRVVGCMFTDLKPTASSLLQALYDEAALQTLRNAKIVGMTTSGVAARKDLVAKLAPKVMQQLASKHDQ